MEFIDLGKQYAQIESDVQQRIQRILDAHTYIMGPEVAELENELAKFSGVEYCVCCGSGTEALQIPLMAYELRSTDAVFVPSFTFFSTAECVSLVGGVPVFVEVDETFNMDPRDLESKIKHVIEEGVLVPRGVIAVDLFGRSADYDQIRSIADKYGLFLLEDAAQGFGGSLRGKRNGSFGDVGATSFFPAKPLGCYGDGGAIFTNDEALYRKLKSIREHGKGVDKYDNERIGINGRMDTIQAAVVLAKLEIFETELQRRQEVAKRYSQQLGNAVTTPLVDEDHYSAWAQYTIRLKDEAERETVRQALQDEDIPSMIYYPIPLHKQKAYSSVIENDVELPFTEALCNQVLSLPMHPYLSDQEIDRICEVVLAAIRER